MELYHGTNTEFEEFSNEFLSSENSIDQYGSGFYFYSDKSKTALHGSLRVYADVTIKKSVEHTTKIKLTRKNIEAMILACPNLEYCLENYGEIDYEGFDKVLKRAVDSYMGLHFLDCLNCLGNDFFPGKDCHILLSKFAEIKGIDCITDKSRYIYVILTKKQITIKKVVNEQDDN